jgi:UDP-GlcNAc:undecaprenyl-phosphate/decaprenyl-phosphate GlcNAc-1-phosphate transferase
MILLYLAFFGVAFLTSLAITPFIRGVGIRFGILDLPGKRKIHQEEIPRLGGVAIFLATLIPFLGFVFWGDFLSAEIQNSWKPFLGLSLGCLIVFGVGIWDDIFRLSPWPKLLVEIGAALVAFAFGLKIELLSNPFGMQLDLSWLSGPLSVIWLVGITNAINLADGIDGLAAGIATFAAAILFFMTVQTAYALVPFLAVALFGASLGFLRYNFSPATIFLGDSGSLFLGFYLGCLSLWASEKSTIAFALLIPIIALGLPILDMIYAILRRWNRGVSIGQADRDHIHHKLLEKGFSQRKAVLLLYGINLILAGFSGFLLFTRNSSVAYIVIAIGGVFILGSRSLGYFKFSRIFQDVISRWKKAQKAKYLAFRTRLLDRAFKNEKTLMGRWLLVGELFEELGIGKAIFTLDGESKNYLEWVNPLDPESIQSIDFTLSLFGDQGPRGTLQIIWNTNQELFPPGISRILAFMAKDFCRDLIESEPLRKTTNNSPSIKS